MKYRNIKLTKQLALSEFSGIFANDAFIHKFAKILISHINPL